MTEKKAKLHVATDADKQQNPEDVRKAMDDDTPEQVATKQLAFMNSLLKDVQRTITTLEETKKPVDVIVRWIEIEEGGMTTSACTHCKKGAARDYLQREIDMAPESLVRDVMMKHALTGLIKNL
jgi:hypothetical protein